MRASPQVLVTALPELREHFCEKGEYKRSRGGGGSEGPAEQTLLCPLCSYWVFILLRLKPLSLLPLSPVDPQGFTVYSSGSGF